MAEMTIKEVLTTSNKVIMGVTFAVAIYIGVKMGINLFIPVFAWVFALLFVSPFFEQMARQEMIEKEIKAMEDQNREMTEYLKSMSIKGEREQDEKGV